jgi:hypothetical protein
LARCVRDFLQYNAPAVRWQGRNRAIHIPEIHASYLDYLGPDVDTGFRISGFADGGEVLKGVIQHEPYHIVVSTAADALQGPPESPDAVTSTVSDVMSAIRSDHPNIAALESGLIEFG